MNAIETLKNLTFGTELEYTGITRLSLPTRRPWSSCGRALLQSRQGAPCCPRPKAPPLMPTWRSSRTWGSLSPRKAKAA